MVRIHRPKCFGNKTGVGVFSEDGNGDEDRYGVLWSRFMIDDKALFDKKIAKCSHIMKLILG